MSIEEHLKRKKLFCKEIWWDQVHCLKCAKVFSAECSDTTHGKDKKGKAVRKSLCFDCGGHKGIEKKKKPLPVGAAVAGPNEEQPKAQPLPPSGGVGNTVMGPKEAAPQMIWQPKVAEKAIEDLQKQLENEKNARKVAEKVIINLENKIVDTECVICSEVFEATNQQVLKCGHKQWHQKCLEDWFKKKKVCPICNADAE